MSNVNEIDPNGEISWVDTGTGASTDTTICSDNPWKIKKGSLFYYASAKAGTSASDPLFNTSTGVLIKLNYVSLDNPPFPTNGRFETYYKFLEAGDLSGLNNDEGYLTTSGRVRDPDLPL